MGLRRGGDGMATEICTVGWFLGEEGIGVGCLHFCLLWRASLRRDPSS